jgi:hypothetical protein
MIKFARIFGCLFGAAITLHGCVLAIAGNRLFPTTTRGGSQHYWNALVGAFGERGAALVSGVTWFAIGLAIIYFVVAPTKKGTQAQRKTRRGHRRRA